MGSTGGVAAAVRLLEAGIAALSEVDLDGLSDGQQLALLRVVHPLVCRMEAQRSRVIGSVHRRGAVFADGAVSTGAGLRSRLRISDGQAKVRAAAAVRDVPELATAYAAGQVSHAQVSVVAAVVPDIAPEVLAAGAGKLLAEQASQLAPGPLRHAAIHIRDHFDPDAAQRRARQRHEERWLSVARTFDGAVAVQGVLDPDGGELLLNTLTALMPPTAAARPAHASTSARGCIAGPVPAGRQPHPTGRWREAARERDGRPRHPPRRHRNGDARLGRPGWSAPPNAAPSSCATKDVASRAATALHNGPTPTT